MRLIKRNVKNIKIYLISALLLFSQLAIPITALTLPAHAVAPAGSVVDTAGPNDEPGQKDLTYLYIDDAGLPSSLDVEWGWDEIRWNGNNTGDACSLFDTDGDGFANYSICVTIGGNPASQTVDSPRIYSCDADSATNKCMGPTLVAGPYSSSCTVSQQDNDPFPSGDEHPVDTVAECELVISDIDDTLVSAELIDVCSYPSQQPNSDPSDCVVFRTDPTPIIELIKDLEPNSDPGLFNLTIDQDSNTTVTDVADGGTTGEIEYTGQNGKVKIVEEPGSNLVNLDNYLTQVVCVSELSGTPFFDDTRDGSGSRTATVTIPNGAYDIECTFINTRKTGELKVVKDVINDDGGAKTYADFTFTVDGSTNGFVETTSPDGEKLLSLPTGTYSVVEPEANTMGYATTYDNCTEVEVVAGEVATCTITNDDIASTLQVAKYATNDDGGTVLAQSFDLLVNNVSVTGDPVLGGADEITVATYPATDIVPNSPYTISETPEPGYEGPNVSCSDITNGIPGTPLTHPFSVEIGRNVLCNVFNDDIAPTLTLEKKVIKDDGGTAWADDWMLKAQESGKDALIDKSGLPADSLVAETTTATAIAGVAYELSEHSGPDGYKASDWTCDIDGILKGSTVILGLDQDATCTITNDDIAGKLTLRKEVVNDNGGNALPSDWTLSALLKTKLIDEKPTNFVTKSIFATDTYDVPSGTYDLEETGGPLGYASTGIWSCENASVTNSNSVFVPLDTNVVCTITNDDKAPKLTVIKKVVNDDGGTATVSAFDIEKNGTDLLFDGGVVSDDTTTYTSTPVVKANVDYKLTEVLAGTGYSGGVWSCTGQSAVSLEVTVNLDEGEEVTCTIVNDDVAPMLALQKTVVRDDGGTAWADDWTLKAQEAGESPIIHSVGSPADQPEASTEYVNAKAGVAYILSEHSGPDGYAANAEWQCKGGKYDPATNSVTLALAEKVLCNMTNNDIAPTIEVVKRVINDDGGELKPRDFQLTINDHKVSQQKVLDVRAGVKYMVDEIEEDGYEHLRTVCWDKATDKKLEQPLVLNLDQDAKCRVVNDDIAPTITVVKKTIPGQSDQPFAFAVGNVGEGISDSFSLDTDDQTKLPQKHTVTEIKAGTVRVHEFPADGWSNGVVVICTVDNQLPNDLFRFRPPTRPLVFEFDTTDVRFPVELDQDITCTFLNIENGDISVTKFHDVNEDGEFDEKDETTLPDWDMNLRVSKDESIMQTTGDEGSTVFEDLESRLQPYILTEEDQEGWHQTNIYCEYPPKFESGPETPNLGRSGTLLQEFRGVSVFPAHEGERVYVVPGETVNCYVGNTYDPVLEIEKSNDSLEPEVVGNSVTYTITVTVPEESGRVYREGETPNGEHEKQSRGCYSIEEYGTFARQAEIYDEVEDMCGEVMVTDLPPEGFKYVPGSWVAYSDVRGNLETAGVTTEPTYESPGQWNLTSPGSPFLVPGEVITLTYVATIQNEVTNGDYPDTAFVEGYTNSGEKIYGNLHFTGDDPFVGTQVTVLTVDETEQGYVLGTLQVTGSPAILAPIVGALLAVGAVLTVTNRKKRRFFKGFGKSLASMGLGLMISVFMFSSAFAVGSFWTTNISTPEAYTTNGAVNIDYQVTSTESTDQFDVDLHQNGSHILSDDVNVPLGDDPYGNSGRFALTLTTEGTYTFKTEVTETNNGSGTKTSNEVTVTFDKTAPSAPTYNGVTRSGDTYTLSFTAPTGDVSTVNIYASTATQFDLDVSTLVGTVAVTPGETSQFVYTAPDSAQRFFAVTAEDAAGNQSPAVGDQETVTTVIPADGSTDGSSSSTGSDEDGTVSDEAATTDSGVEGATDENGDDESSDTGTIVAMSGIILFIVLAGAAYFMINTNRKPQA